ncbi:hypothetical protein [Jannaschia sp. R86511]|uniref:hypothetical protein n=1 Tax=Jannaschia sp. R86511 TaxID=3093853 RepID=UPI0036D2274D
MRDFVHENQPRTSADVTAEVVGHDLTWGTTSFTANRRSRAEEARDDVDRSDADELAQQVSLEPVDGVEGSFVDTGTGELLDADDELDGTDSLRAGAREAEPAF